MEVKVETEGPLQSPTSTPTSAGGSRSILYARIKRMMQSDEEVGKIAQATPPCMAKVRPATAGRY